MELQNIISAETLGELLSQARKAGWDHTITSMGGMQPSNGRTEYHTHTWRRGQVSVEWDLGRINITCATGTFSNNTTWEFPTDHLDMDGLTLVLSVALTAIGGPGFQVPDSKPEETWEEYADRAPWVPVTCPGGC